MGRYERRKIAQATASVVKKAKLDMEKYVLELNEAPSEKELKAWQAGYIAGLNRGANNK